MTEKEKQTEEKIVEAAREVFIEKGMAGARMQEIADNAGINKSLLHYYFRSKEKLFDFIVSKIIDKIGGRLGEIIYGDAKIEEKIKDFVNMYTDMLMKNPFLPNFIFTEINRNPEGLLKRFVVAEINPQAFFQPLSDQLEAEGYKIGTHDFIINLLSMVIFPFAARPMIENLVFQGDSKEYKAYVKSRKESIVIYVMNALEGFKQ